MKSLPSVGQAVNLRRVANPPAEVSPSSRGRAQGRTTFRAKLARFSQLLLSLLRELADENAYRRHLQAHGRQPSGEEWRRFSEERLRAKYARAKCC